MPSYWPGIFILISLSYISLSESKFWALLAAGSNGYENYRHQADVCHAYQILKKYGVSNSSIITMMYDDIANNSENPTPGIIINRPEGKNVYAGVNKDYTGKDVNVDNFFSILSGQKKRMNGIGSGRVIESGPDDTIFIFLAGHGAEGLFAFRRNILYAKDLNKSLTLLHKNKKFQRLIFYLSSCHSGSMFSNILSDEIKVFAMTDAHPGEDSYATYFSDEKQAYLGDQFSVSWTEQLEKKNFEKYSLHKLYGIVRHRLETEDEEYKSHPQEYGDLDLGVMKVSETFGRPNWTEFQFVESLDVQVRPKSSGKSVVSSFEVPLHLLHKKLQKLEVLHAKKEAELVRGQIATILENRKFMASVMDELIFEMAGNNEFSTQLRNNKASITRDNIDCYDTVLKEFSNTCFDLSENPYVGTQVHILLNACDLFDNDESKIIRNIHQVCRKLKPMPKIV